MPNLKMPLVSAIMLLMTAVGHGATMRTAGMLTCALEPASGRTNEISCTYSPTSGAPSKFRGVLTQLGDNAKLQSARVMVWTVLSPTTVEPADLNATFVRKNPAPDLIPEAFRKGLFGGAEGEIALVPPSGNKQIPGNAAVTVLELNLMSVRV